LREAQGWKCSLVIDATLMGGSLQEVPVERSTQVKLDRLPVFAVAILSVGQTDLRVDFVDLCPLAMRKLFHER